MEDIHSDKMLEMNKALALDLISFMDLSSDEEEHARKETHRRIREYQRAMERMNARRRRRHFSSSSGRQMKANEPLFTGEDVSSLPKQEIAKIWRPQADDTVSNITRPTVSNWRPHMMRPAASKKTGPDDVYTREINRALYGDATGQPAANTTAYFDAAQKYATYGNFFNDFPNDLSQLYISEPQAPPARNSTELKLPREPPGFEGRKPNVPVAAADRVVANLAAVNNPQIPKSNATNFFCASAAGAAAVSAAAPSATTSTNTKSPPVPPLGVNRLYTQAQKPVVTTSTTPTSGSYGVYATTPTAANANKYTYLASSVPTQYVYQPSSQPYVTVASAPGVLYSNQSTAAGVDVRWAYALQQQQYRGPYSRAHLFSAQAQKQQQQQQHAQQHFAQQQHAQHQLQAQQIHAQQLQVQQQLLQYQHQQQQQQQQQQQKSHATMSGPYSRIFGTSHFSKENATNPASGSSSSDSLTATAFIAEPKIDLSKY